MDHQDIHDMPMGALLGRNAHLSRGVIETYLEVYDLPLSQTHLLTRLHMLGGQAAQSVLTSHLHVKPSTVNGLVERLEERGLVSRTTDPNDGRQRLVTLTDKGQALHADLKVRLDQGDASLTACFTEQERQTLRSLLIRMAQYLEQEKTLC